jgi:hypothetical protein
MPPPAPPQAVAEGRYRRRSIAQSMEIPYFTKHRTGFCLLGFISDCGRSIAQSRIQWLYSLLSDVTNRVGDRLRSR